MDAPRIQYAKSGDGFDIAYWTLGHGQPVVDMGTPPFSHIQLEWQLPELRSWYERLADHHQLVRFDGRGTGLSTREIAEYSLETMILDLEAVVDRLRLRRFTLIGAINSGVAAMVYAARRPERVSRLILWCAYAQGKEYFEDTGTLALRAVVDQDWRMFSETAAHSRFGWSEGEPARRFAELIRAAVTPAVQGALMDALRYVDVTDVLPRVTAPTLVLQREDRGAEVARRIAALIPDAQVVLFKGGSAAPYLSDADDVWRVMADFIDVGAKRPDPGVLTAREADVLRLVAGGLSNREVSQQLVISVRTVERHISNIYAKIGARGKADATAYALRHSLI